MKNKDKLLVTSVLILPIIAFFTFKSMKKNKRKLELTNVISLKEKDSESKSIDTNPEKFDNKKDIKENANSKFSIQEKKSSDQFFNKNVISGEPTKKLYEKTLSIFGESTYGQGASRWITLGIMFDSSPEYGSSLKIAQHDANTNPQEIWNSIQKSLTIIRNDPFIYEMTVNLMHVLDLPSDQKAKFYGEEFQHQFSNVSGEPSTSFWVSTIGFVFAQQEGISGDLLKPYFKKAFKETKASEKVKLEMQTAIEFYFPDVSI